MLFRQHERCPYKEFPTLSKVRVMHTCGHVCMTTCRTGNGEITVVVIVFVVVGF